MEVCAIATLPISPSPTVTPNSVLSIALPDFLLPSEGQVHLKTHRAGRECIRNCMAVPIAGAGISEVVGFVSDGTDVIVRRIPDLTHGHGSKSAGKSRIGKTSARLAAIGGADLVLEAVHRGQPVGNLRRALDAPARAAVKVLAVCAAAGLQSAAQRAIPRSLGKNNGGYTQFFSRK